MQASELSPYDLSLFYHEAPDDIMEMILLFLSNVDEDGKGTGGMNVLRLVSKRLMRLVESCATRITSRLGSNGPDELPHFLMRHMGIEHITCCSWNLRSLNGCPSGLKSLQVDVQSMKSLEPLRKCVNLELLKIYWAHHISDLNPLVACTKMNKLQLGHSSASDLSPLASMPLLEELLIIDCYKVESLDPISGLQHLNKLDCRGIDPKASLLPLASCTGLKELWCSEATKDIKQLMSKMPDLHINDWNE